MNIFNHEPQDPAIYLYVEIDGNSKPIKFYNKESPYSNSPNGHGGFYPYEVDSRHIEIVDDLKLATKMKELTTFIEWRKDAILELKAFLDKHNLEKKDLKIIKVVYPEPQEQLIDSSFFEALF